ncbi:MAG: 3-isopropylmalate dehydratase small subunit [Elusimicrobia bacterium]|nr:3-isopropylmalate dehydratase small subunit [Elusimicrobiota bacterium]
MVKGKVWKFEDNISTDLICPGRYYHLRGNLPELAKHTLEDADPEFPKKVEKGDIIVAGKNFGCGSSREHAARVIKISGVGAVLAKSFARIFFRNAINIGLPVIEIDTSDFNQGDEVEIDLEKGILKNLTNSKEYEIKPLPQKMIEILNSGGLVEYIKKKGSL